AVDERSSPPMNRFSKASSVPDASLRACRLIVPLCDEPGTSDQLRILPEKMSETCCWVRPLASLLLGLVMRQTASPAILTKLRRFGSVFRGSRDDMPIVTAPFATSAMPLSEPPWATRKLTFLLSLAYFAVSAE